MLVTVVIMSAVIPTLIGQAFFQPQLPGQHAVLTVEAEDEVDAVRRRA
jgi:hypothetical protein